MTTDGYRPMDLSAYYNRGVAVLGEGAGVPPTGDQLFHGLPFRIGQGEKALILFGPDGLDQSLSIPIDSSAYTVIVAHRLLDSQLIHGAVPGTSVATYTFGLSDGTEHRISMRERFEIGDVVAWGQQPFLARPDQSDSLLARWSGS